MVRTRKKHSPVLVFLAGGRGCSEEAREPNLHVHATGYAAGEDGENPLGQRAESRGFRAQSGQAGELKVGSHADSGGGGGGGVGEGRWCVGLLLLLCC